MALSRSRTLESLRWSVARLDEGPGEGGGREGGTGPAAPVGKLLRLCERFEDGMRRGIERRRRMEREGGAAYDERDYCGLKMLRSYVRSLPRGDEAGVFYSVDVGGTNLRVMKVDLALAAGAGAGGGFGSSIVAVEETEIPKALMESTIGALFAFIAARIVAFVGARHAPGAEGRLGVVAFTFSFPMMQTAIDAGTLIDWTKGFNCVDGVGEDVVATLQRSVDAAVADRDVGVDAIRVVALANDTVGALAAARFVDADVQASVICGTGTNAAYVCGPGDPSARGDTIEAETMINIEWGNFFCEELVGGSEPGGGGFRLPADAAVDGASPNAGKQFFEKMTAGMYLGEISRRTALAIAEEQGPGAGAAAPLASRAAARPFALTTPMMAEVEACARDAEGERALADIVLRAFGVPGDESELSARLGGLLRTVCPLVRARAAQLIAAALAAVLSVSLSRADGGTRGRRVAVAVDGGLYEHYAAFREDLNRTVASLFRRHHPRRAGGPEHAIDVGAWPDGSAFGAAVIAAKTV